MSIDAIRSGMHTSFEFIENAAEVCHVISGLAAALLAAVGATFLAAAGTSYLFGKTVTEIVFFIITQGRLLMGHDPALLARMSLFAFKWAAITLAVSLSFFGIKSVAGLAKEATI
jgi:hypothetical protein